MQKSCADSRKVGAAPRSVLRPLAEVGISIVRLIFFQPEQQSRESASGLEPEGSGTSSDLNQDLSLNPDQTSAGDVGNRCVVEHTVHDNQCAES